MLCDYDQCSLAPRDTCGCRHCSSEREKLLDPALIEIVDKANRPSFVAGEIPTPTAEIVRRWVYAYLGGLTDLPTARIEIIKSLMRFSDTLYREAVDARLIDGLLARIEPAQKTLPSENA